MRTREKIIKMMNKKQKIIGIIFTTVILITSFCILERSALAGIIGLCVSAGLFIYCFSGNHEESTKKYSFKAILKSKIVKRILIGGLAGVIIFIIIGIASSIQYKKQIKINEEKQKAAEVFSYKYLQDNIEIISSRIDSEESDLANRALYLFIQIRNKGDEVAGNFFVQLTYYDYNKYLINRQTVNISELISPGEEKKFKVLLFKELYPYSEITKIKSFEITPISCEIFTSISGE